MIEVDFGLKFITATIAVIIATGFFLLYYLTDYPMGGR